MKNSQRAAGTNPAAIRRLEKMQPIKNATMEKIFVKIYPVNETMQPYVITFEHAAPHFVSRKLAEQVLRLLEEEYIAEGVDHIVRQSF